MSSTERSRRARFLASAAAVVRTGAGAAVDRVGAPGGALETVRGRPHAAAPPAARSGARW